MPNVTRYVIGPNANKQSAVLYHDSTNIQQEQGIYWRTTLWATSELPVDNTKDGDRAFELGERREPAGNGLIFRALEIPPDMKDQKKHADDFTKLNKEVDQKYTPTAKDSERSPTMHRTDTLDCFVIGSGEIYLVTDADETLLKSGDTVVIRGVNHAWSNRSDKPCMVYGFMTAANPWPADRYPAADDVSVAVSSHAG